MLVELIGVYIFVLIRRIYGVHNKIRYAPTGGNTTYLYSTLVSVFAGIVVWFISPFIKPLQGDLRLGVALGGAFLVSFVAVVFSRRGAARTKSGGTAKPRPHTGTRVASTIKANGNVAVRVDGVETSAHDRLDVGSNIRAGKDASIHVKNVKNNP